MTNAKEPCAHSLGYDYVIGLAEDSNVEERCSEESRKIGTKTNEVPPWEIQMKAMLASIIVLNPLCAPVVWYILRGYKQRWRDGFHSAARSYMKHALIIFSLGILLTLFLVIALLVHGFSGQSRNDLNTKIGDVYVKTDAKERSITNRTEVSTSSNFTEVMEENRRHVEQTQALDTGKSGEKFSKLDTLHDGEIRFQNKTFIQICSPSSGRCASLNIPENMDLDKP